MTTKIVIEWDDETWKNTSIKDYEEDQIGLKI
jgi:hypothetical protein